jgi:hypothetical protein
VLSHQDLIDDRIDLEDALTELVRPFLKKYPQFTHTISSKLSYGDHLATVVRITSQI